MKAIEDGLEKRHAIGFCLVDWRCFRDNLSRKPRIVRVEEFGQGRGSFSYGNLVERQCVKC